MLHCYLRYIYPQSIGVQEAFNDRRVKIMKLNRRPYQSNERTFIFLPWQKQKFYCFLSLIYL